MVQSNKVIILSLCLSLLACKDTNNGGFALTKIAKESFDKCGEFMHVNFSKQQQFPWGNSQLLMLDYISNDPNFRKIIKFEFLNNAEFKNHHVSVPDFGEYRTGRNYICFARFYSSTFAETTLVVPLLRKDETIKYLRYDWNHDENAFVEK